VRTEDLLTELAQARGLKAGEYLIPRAKLAPLPAEAQIVWQVEAVLPDGETIKSPTFLTTLRQLFPRAPVPCAQLIDFQSLEDSPMMREIIFVALLALVIEQWFGGLSQRSYMLSNGSDEGDNTTGGGSGHLDPPPDAP
jgi:hypothetical protein